MDKKEMKPLIKGGAKPRKDRSIDKILGSFLATDSVNLKEYIINDVVIPLIKRGISGTVDMLLYGRTRSVNDNGNYWHTGGAKTTSYNNFYDSGKKQAPKAAVTNTIGYKNLVFDTRGDAEVVLKGMQDAIEQFSIVSVIDMYDMARVPTDNFTLNHYGWTSVEGVGVIRDPEGFVINLPRPMPIQ